MAQYYAHGLATGTYRGQTFANRQPLPFDPDTADFSDQHDRVMLSSIGIFSVDSLAHRIRRSLELRERLMLEVAFHAIGLDRDREHAKIAARLEAGKTDGVWARSTKAYALACHELDRAISHFVYTGGLACA